MQKLSHHLDNIIKPIPKFGYVIDIDPRSLESALESYTKHERLNLCPDFQRGHVWTEDQQIKFIEALMRGTASPALRTIQFNHPSFQRERAPDCDLENEMVCIDGLQRLTALRKFMAGDIKPFGLSHADLEGTSYAPHRISIYGLKFAIFEFQYRKDLLQYYIDINTGGVVHSESEIQRVKGLLDCSTTETLTP